MKNKHAHHDEQYMFQSIRHNYGKVTNKREKNKIYFYFPSNKMMIMFVLVIKI